VPTGHTHAGKGTGVGCSVDEECPADAPIDAVTSVEEIFLDEVTAKRAVVRMEAGKRFIDLGLRVTDAGLELHCQCIEDSEASCAPARYDTKPSSLVEKRCHESVVLHELMVAPKALSMLLPIPPWSTTATGSSASGCEEAGDGRKTTRIPRLGPDGDIAAERRLSANLGCQRCLDCERHQTVDPVGEVPLRRLGTGRLVRYPETAAGDHFLYTSPRPVLRERLAGRRRHRTEGIDELVLDVIQDYGSTPEPKNLASPKLNMPLSDPTSQ
jgi:hypothetical protein